MKEIEHMKGKILIIDDAKSFNDRLGENLEKENYEVESAYSYSSGIRKLGDFNPDLLLLDLILPEEDLVPGEDIDLSQKDRYSMDLLEKSQELDGNRPAIIISDYDKPENVINSLKRGAYYFVGKREFGEGNKYLLNSIELALRTRFSTTRNEENHGIIGTSEKITDLLYFIKKAASAPEPILILGERGTGKELTARAIHQASDRADKIFVGLNCSAVPETLIESELFGCMEGAHSTATKSREGLLEATSGGTLFMDEIGDIPMAMQMKLLRVLQEKEIRKIGENKSRKIDTRFIFATNKNLEEEIEKNNFREDFYDRINIIDLKVPPLRERREDIAFLAKFLVKKICGEHGRDPLLDISHDAVSLLIENDWPGNVRQLENTIRKMVALTEEQYSIGAADAKRALGKKKAGKTLEEAVDDFSKAYIENKLDKFGGDVKSAMNELGMSRPNLYKRMKKYGIAARK